MDRPNNSVNSGFRLSQAFAHAASNLSAGKSKGKRKFPPPFSLRLTFEERARLEQDAGSQSLGSYIRSKLFGEAAGGSRSRTRYPVKDEQALAKVLGELGQSRIANNLNQLAKAVNCGSLEVTPETEGQLLEACEAIKAMRRDLIAALGLDAGGPS